MVLIEFIKAVNKEHQLDVFPSSREKIPKTYPHLIHCQGWQLHVSIKRLKEKPSGGKDVDGQLRPLPDGLKEDSSEETSVRLLEHVRSRSPGEKASYKELGPGCPGPKQLLKSRVLRDEFDQCRLSGPWFASDPVDITGISAQPLGEA
jgi:hypothetical protein